MKQNHLKVPEDLIRKANERGLYSQVKFYYELKALKEDGCFKKSDWNLIKKTYKYVDSTLYKKFRNLVEVGFAKEFIIGIFNLISYDNLWILFNYDKDYCLNPSKNKDESFKIFRISINDILHNEFLYSISIHEIKHNFNKQAWTSSINMFLTQKSNKVKTVKNSNTQIPLPILGCRGLSGILGFASPSTGYKIFRRLEECGAIEITRKYDENGLPKCYEIFILRRTVTSR